MTAQLQTVSTRGEMGTFYNILTHSLNVAFSDQVGNLLEYLGRYSRSCRYGRGRLAYCVSLCFIFNYFYHPHSVLKGSEVDSLPPAAMPPHTYAGTARLIVPTVRTTLFAEEHFWIQVFLFQCGFLSSRQSTCPSRRTGVISTSTTAP
jgi:hypothetical protein